LNVPSEKALALAKARIAAIRMDRKIVISERLS
jgi:hypothetical protein